MSQKKILKVDNVNKTFFLKHAHPGSLKGRIVRALHGEKQTETEKFKVIENISFDISEGESMALLGHNGSGKSTLLQLIAGVITPDSGSIKIYGRITPLLELGVGFHPELNGIENIYLNASIYGMRNRDTAKIIKDIIEFSGLGKFIDTPVKHYSSGMYMRLGFSVAAHMNPKIILADEILAVGDTEFQNKCLDKIKELQREGTSVILVTHSVEQAKQFCNSYVRLDHGKMVASGYF